MGRRAIRLLAFVVAASATAVASAGAAKPVLQQPFDLLPLAGGSFVVTDLPAGAVYAIDPMRKSGRRVAGVPEARELARLPDGRILVTSQARVLALNLRTGKTTLFAAARSYILGIALGPDGWLYASENTVGQEETTLVRLRGGKRQVLARNLRGVHGILVTRTGLILSEAYGGRVLRLDPASRKLDVLATGLGNPSFTLPATGGGYFVSEFTGNRISHLWPDGHVTKVVDVFQPGPIDFDGHHRIVGLTLGGTLFRVEGGQARTIYP